MVTVFAYSGETAVRDRVRMGASIRSLPTVCHVGGGAAGVGDIEQDECTGVYVKGDGGGGRKEVEEIPIVDERAEKIILDMPSTTVVVGLDWTPQYLRTYVDGKVIRNMDNR